MLEVRPLVVLLQRLQISSGKNKPEYTPNADLGDYVIVVNANEINVTGKKLDQKMYYRHSGYPGGIKSKPLRDVMENTASDAIKSAVKGMLPKNKLGRKMFFRNLRFMMMISILMPHKNPSH